MLGITQVSDCAFREGLMDLVWVAQKWLREGFLLRANDQKIEICACARPFYKLWRTMCFLVNLFSPLYIFFLFICHDFRTKEQRLQPGIPGKKQTTS